MDRLAEFLFEIGILKQTPRSGWHFLPGAQGESVAEHVYRTTLIAWVLGRLDSTLDTDRLIRLAMVHDLPETRTGDLNYVHQKYISADEEVVAQHQARGLHVGDELEELLAEYRAGSTPEAKTAHDADQLEMLLSLKERLDAGAPAASEWLPFVESRLQTENARRLAEKILASHSHDWWFDRESDWWVRGGKE